jgi:8-oxo-dGTP pyrophosphatase MutT (NUDIX family)
MIGEMTKVSGVKLLPLDMAGLKKLELRTQFAALCWRIHKEKLQFLLITSLATKRWIIPKGWPMDGQTAAEAAAQEAWEEAGVVGKASNRCAGIYTYVKNMGDHRLPVVAAVFPVQVKRLRDDYPEAGLRKRRWMKRSKAVAMVSEPELASIIKSFDPRV